MTNKLNLEEIILKNKKVALETQAILNLAIKKNDNNFIQSIKEQNLNNASKHNEWGLSWEKQDFWTQLKKIISSISPNLEIINFLMTLQPEKMVEKSDNSSYGQFVYHISKTPKENLSILLEESFSKKLEYGEFNLDVFSWAIKKKPELFNVKSVITNSLRSFTLVKDISNEKYNPVHEFILEKNKDFLPFVFQETVKTGNIRFFMNSPYYKEVFQNFLVLNSSEEFRKNIMNEAITAGNLESIQFWHEQGIPLPSHHHPYTALFSTDKKLPAMKYALEHMDNVTMHKQCILKCALHNNIYNIIPTILNKYTEEEKKELHLAIANRDNSKSVEIVQNYINEHNIEPKTVETTNTQNSQSKIKMR